RAVSVMYTYTNAVIATIGIGGAPVGVAITPDGSRAYVANNSIASVSVIDTATNTVIATVAQAQPVGVAITPDGSRAYVSNNSTAAGSVSVIDTATNTVTAKVGVGLYAQRLAITVEGTYLFVAFFSVICVFLLDPATYTFS